MLFILEPFITFFILHDCMTYDSNIYNYYVTGITPLLCIILYYALCLNSK